MILIAAFWLSSVSLPGLHQPVEILRDRWGIPHIFARNQHDLFFAQGYMAARDRLWQIDWWRRVGTGRLAEVLGPSAIPRDRIARLVRFRGDWEAEWAAYGPDTRAIATAFTSGINAHIGSLKERPPEFAAAGYDPGRWAPEDCVARMAGLIMMRNLTREVQRANDIRRFGLAKVQQFLPPDPPVRIEIPKGLDIADVPTQISLETGVGGSNNWVVHGSRTVTGKPLLANDPHRPVQIPSLRRTVHLVAPGWNVMGAGEPALPGIALGHNQRIGFGFTIVGIDQQDLFVETLNPADPDQYLYRGAWRRMEVERQPIAVKGREPETVELRYTLHGPVIHIDRARRRAYALRWVGAEPGGAGYLAALALSRARNWEEFTSAVERYKVPSENLVYADVDGNIGWQAAGLTPIRRNWSGLLPVPGDTGEYEWGGFRRMAELPRRFNPPEGFIATANHNILPPGYTLPLSYEWALPFRFERVREMLSAQPRFSVADFERMQQDVVSIPARRLQGIIRRWSHRPPAAEELLRWDVRLTPDSHAAYLFQVWMRELPASVFGPELGARVSIATLLETLENSSHDQALAESLERALGSGRRRWGEVHRIEFRHPLNVEAWNRGPIERPGDGNTVNATSGASFRQTGGASYRQILDLSDWDKSVMSNVPGESGDPRSPHYSDLLEEWAEGRYHPMLYSRAAVERHTVERIRLVPAR